jgi:hypothetical protein
MLDAHRSSVLGETLAVRPVLGRVLLNPWVGGRIQHPASSIQHRVAPRLKQSGRVFLLAVALLGALAGSGSAQEIEPRVYANIPVGMNFLAVGYSYSSGNVFMDPSLPIENLDAGLNIILARYIRSFNLFGAPAKFKAVLPWSSGHWDGVLDGDFQTRDTSGFADARLGLGVLLVGAPVLESSEFSTYEQEMVVGLGFSLVAPTGQYDPRKIINLGSNRWSFRSEIGLSKAFNKWTVEVAGGVWVYTDNGDFLGGNILSQDPFLVAKVNVVRSVRPGMWWAVGTGYGQGGRTFVNGDPRNTKQKNWRLSAMMVFPLSPTQGLSLTAASGRTFQAGADFDVVAIAYQFAWN